MGIPFLPFRQARTCRFGRPSHVNRAGEGTPSDTVMAVL